ncbi:hypothetical protein [Runella sp.]|uniref:hypothetical protein n=1 Tax=Runella sp. TaxID=1960881 RepID=UPI003D13EA37
MLKNEQTPLLFIKRTGSIYPSTRQPAGNVLTYQEYWFRIQSQNGIGIGGARLAADNGQQITELLPKCA